MNGVASEFEAAQTLSLAKKVLDSIFRSIQGQNPGDASGECGDQLDFDFARVDIDIQTLTSHVLFERAEHVLPGNWHNWKFSDRTICFDPDGYTPFAHKFCGLLSDYSDLNSDQTPFSNDELNFLYARLTVLERRYCTPTISAVGDRNPNNDGRSNQKLNTLGVLQYKAESPCNNYDATNRAMGEKALRKLRLAQASLYKDSND